MPIELLPVVLGGVTTVVAFGFGLGPLPPPQAVNKGKAEKAARIRADRWRSGTAGQCMVAGLEKVTSHSRQRMQPIQGRSGSAPDCMVPDAEP
ncbi:MAG: hypothetical protein U1F63_02775 [Chitinivorax sp.]